MQKTAVALMFCAALVCSSREAAAQWTDRGYINFSTGIESHSSDLNDTRNYVLYDEPATTNTSAITRFMGPLLPSAPPGAAETVSGTLVVDPEPVKTC